MQMASQQVQSLTYVGYVSFSRLLLQPPTVCCYGCLLLQLVEEILLYTTNL